MAYVAWLGAGADLLITTDTFDSGQLLSGSVDAGDRIVMAIGADASFGGVSSVHVDDGFQAYDLSPDVTITGDECCEIWSTDCGGGLGTASVTIVFLSVSSGEVAMNAASDTGNDTIDGNASASATSPAPSVGLAAVSQTPGTSYAAICSIGALGPPDPSPDGPYTDINLIDGLSGLSLDLAYYELPDTTDVTAEWSMTSEPWAGVVQNYTQAGGGGIKILSVTAGEKSNTVFDIVKTSILATTAAEKSGTSVALTKTAVLAVTAAEKSNTSVSLTKTAAVAVTAAEKSGATVALVKTAVLAVTAAETSNATVALVKTAPVAVTAPEKSNATIALVKTAPVAVTAPETSNATIALTAASGLTVAAPEVSNASIALVKTAALAATAPEVSNCMIGLQVTPPAGTGASQRTRVGVGL